MAARPTMPPMLWVTRCSESLARLGTDHFDLLYLHAPDPQVPIEESAGALADMRAAGITRAVGLSNASVPQLERFAAACPLAACQMQFNMLQRQIEADRRTPARIRAAAARCS